MKIIKDNSVRIYQDNRKTEEVQEIIDRMPTKFGWWITCIVIFVIALIIVFGWIIRYPDIISGQITINTNISPIKLVAMSSGKLRLKVDHSQVNVNRDEVIAYIDNSASLDTLNLINKLLNNYNPLTRNNTAILEKLPKRIALGAVTVKYYSFLENLHQLRNFRDDRAYEMQIEGLNNLLFEQKRNVSSIEERIRIGESNMKYSRKFFSRDSILFGESVISEAELDQARLNYLDSKEKYQNVFSDQIVTMQNVRQTETQIGQVVIQMKEKENDLQLAVVSSYNDLKDNINTWGQNYVLRAPFNGKVQFLDFWADGQFVQNGQPLFTVVPDEKSVYGQVILPASGGAGKVVPGQDVIIKLDNYPYLEYGYIEGIVNSMSLTTNTEKTPQGDIETYLVTVTLINGLVTNYEKHLNFKEESKGTAEIVTNDRRLIQRFFDGLKYMVKK